MIDTNAVFSQDNSPRKTNSRLESKLTSRTELLEDHLNNIDYAKEQAIQKELSIKTMEREKLFKYRRTQKKINVDCSSSLKDQLTIPISVFEECNKLKVQKNELQAYISNFKSSEIPRQYFGLVGLRKLLSIAQHPPIQQIIDAGLITDFITLLDYNYAEFQFEALWCLTNVASGTSDQVNAIITQGGLDKIISLMNSKIQEIQEQATWALGNIVGDSSKTRERIIQHKGYDTLVKIFSTTERHSLIKQCTWTMANFCKTKPPMDYSLIEPMIDLVSISIYKLKHDVEFLCDACWILSYVSENYRKSISKLIDLEIVQILIELLNIQIVNIQLPCLRVIGNIATGDANSTQKIIDWGVLPYLKKTVFSEKKPIRKESCWIFSNIAAGTQEQINILIENDILPILITVIETDEPDIQKEAIWAVCNLTSTDKKPIIEKIISQGIIDIVCKCIKVQDARVITAVLEALGNLLKIGQMHYDQEGKNSIAQKVETLGIFDVLESFQYHPVQIIYEKSLYLMEMYFDVENYN